MAMGLHYLGATCSRTWVHRFVLFARPPQRRELAHPRRKDALNNTLAEEKKALGDGDHRSL